MRWRGISVCTAAALVPSLASAHASPGGFVLLLPTGYWMAGGAAAVALSFALLALSLIHI